MSDAVETTRFEKALKAFLSVFSLKNVASVFVGFVGTIIAIRLLRRNQAVSLPARLSVIGVKPAMAEQSMRSFSQPFEAERRSWVGSFLDSIFEGTPTQYDDELRLQPVSVMTYCYLLPTHHNEDGVFVRLVVENTSELATQE
uniref:Gsp-co-occurring protein 7 n=1 Tax=Malawimonas jakobiformis TaxID=136089 RepID=A0A895KNQ2_MALJA|nr:Gsp-co-occurring protein 7 [Malawimonas jakobiformis]